MFKRVCSVVIIAFLFSVNAFAVSLTGSFTQAFYTPSGGSQQIIPVSGTISDFDGRLAFAYSCSISDSSSSYCNISGSAVATVDGVGYLPSSYLVRFYDASGGVLSSVTSIGNLSLPAGAVRVVINSFYSTIPAASSINYSVVSSYSVSVSESPEVPPTLEAPGSFMGSLAQVSNSVLTFSTVVADKVMSEPLLLFTVGFLFLGGVVAIFGRLLSRA